MNFEKQKEPFFINSLDNVLVTEAGWCMELLYLEKYFNTCVIRNIGDGKYMDTRTGEIKEYQEHLNTRVEHYNSLLRSFKYLKNLINTNITIPKNVLFVTLTYADNMQDNKRLYADLKNFHKRFNYYLKIKMNIAKPKYIDICEPQGRGAWHCHSILIFDNKAPFIANNIIANIWGYGFTKTEKLKDNIDNFGNYFVAYFTDIEITNHNLIDLLALQNISDLPNGYGIVKEKMIENENGENIKKNILKGGRLLYYPSNFNIYRASKDINRPIKEKMTYEKALKKASCGVLTSSNSFVLTDDNKIINRFRRDKYNLKSSIE